MARKIAWIREAAGDRFTRIELSVITTPMFTSNRSQGARQVAQTRGWSSMSVEEILQMPTIFIGTVEQVAEQMLERRERFGISYYITPDRMMEAYVPLVERLSGR
jgi:alkanesulfonate monooxygenase SsuD/methylene tetrahydromethanopterin reductase-like flavin-dependent oxidoreductase (luciferase family)